MVSCVSCSIKEVWGRSGVAGTPMRRVADSTQRTAGIPVRGRMAGDAILARTEAQQGVLMSSGTSDGMRNFLRDHNIHEVECVIADMTGIARGKILPKDLFLAGEHMRLPKS